MNRRNFLFGGLAATPALSLGGKSQASVAPPRSRVQCVMTVPAGERIVAMTTFHDQVFITTNRDVYILDSEP